MRRWLKKLRFPCRKGQGRESGCGISMISFAERLKRALAGVRVCPRRRFLHSLCDANRDENTWPTGNGCGWTCGPLQHSVQISEHWEILRSSAAQLNFAIVLCKPCHARNPSCTETVLFHTYNRLAACRKKVQDAATSTGMPAVDSSLFPCSIGGTFSPEPSSPYRNTTSMSSQALAVSQKIEADMPGLLRSSVNTGLESIVQSSTISWRTLAGGNDRAGSLSACLLTGYGRQTMYRRVTPFLIEPSVPVRTKQQDLDQ